MFKTYQPKETEVTRKWHLFDADGKTLGRIATQIATFLIGKHKPTYSAHMDSGDFVVVLNSVKVKVTGNKEEGKTYYSHSGYPGGLKERSLKELRAKNPNKIIELAVRGMLPDNRLRAKRMARLKVFSGEKNEYKEKFANSGNSK